MSKNKKGFFTRLYRWATYPYPLTRHCTCGQENSGICTARFQLSGAGVLAQDSAKLLACGRVRRQIQRMESTRRPRDISTQEIVDDFASHVKG